ncbi:hypothetical protein D3C72_1377400 [compost metagenome]
MLGLELELEALVLGFALLRSGLVKQFLLSAGCGFAFCLLLLRHALALGLNCGLLRQSNTVLLGALFCFSAQAGKFGLLGFELLALLERCPQSGQDLVLGVGRFCLEFLPVGAKLHAFGFGNQAFELQGVQVTQVVGQCFQPVQTVVVAINAGVLGGFPLGERPARLVPQRVHRGHELTQLGLDHLRHFLEPAQVVAARLLDGGFRLAHLGGQAGDAFAALAGDQVGHFAFDLGLHQVDELLQAAGHVDGRGVLLADLFDRDQFLFCGH